MSYHLFEIQLDEARDAESYRRSYDTLHKQSTIGMRDSFYEWILDLMDVRAWHCVLDVAGGNGALARRARARDVSAITLDLSFNASRQAHANSVMGDGHALPFADNTFERVASIGSLEHYTDPLKGAHELGRVLRPDGLLCVLLPNLYSLLGNVWAVFRHGQVYIDDQPIQRYATLVDWQRLLEVGGLRIERVVKYERERPRYWRDVTWYLTHAKSLARLALTPVIPLRFAACLVFLCRKR